MAICTKKTRHNSPVVVVVKSHLKICCNVCCSCIGKYNENLPLEKEKHVVDSACLFCRVQKLDDDDDDGDLL